MNVNKNDYNRIENKIIRNKLRMYAQTHKTKCNRIYSQNVK